MRTWSFNIFTAIESLDLTKNDLRNVSKEGAISGSLVKETMDPKTSCWISGWELEDAISLISGFTHGAIHWGINRFRISFNARADSTSATTTSGLLTSSGTSATRPVLAPSSATRSLLIQSVFGSLLIQSVFGSLLVQSECPGPLLTRLVLGGGARKMAR